MSLSSSISNAFSGLTVTARAAQLVSSNLSNALNEDYSRREIEISSYHQGGAKFVKTNRFVDRALTSDLRNARSSLGFNNVRAESAKALEQAVGLPDSAGSLTAHLSRFDASLRYLESDPSSNVRLSDTLSNAIAMTEKLGAIEENIQTQRKRADSQIATTIKSLNSKLQQIVTLNREIVSAQINGRETATWLDQRKQLVDDVSEIVPIREMRRDNEAISLVSSNGMMLVEGSAVQFDFKKSNMIEPHMTLSGGELGALTLGGDPIGLNSNSGPLSGGRLQALFDVRDKISVDAQQQVDSFALSFAERFHGLPNDASSTVSSAGFFTDNGARAVRSDQIGLAGRLAINTNADPTAGGELWRIQSGMQSTSKAAAGDATLISDMISSLSSQSLEGSVFEQAASFVSSLAQLASVNEQQESYANSHFAQLNTLHLENGVNTDAELQKLLQIETNYAANAKVMQTIDEMFAAILRIN